MERDNLDKPKFTAEEMFGFKEKGLNGSLAKIEAKLNSNDPSVEKLIPKLEKALDAISETSVNGIGLSEKSLTRLAEVKLSLEEAGFGVEIGKISIDTIKVDDKIDTIPFEAFTSKQSIERSKLVQNIISVGMNPYDNTFKPDITQKKFNKKFETLDLTSTIKIAGKISDMEDKGNILFLTLERGGFSTEIVLKKNDINQNNKYDTEDLYKFLKHSIQNGDIIGIEGLPYEKPNGDHSLNASSLTIMSKPLIPIAKSYDEKTLALKPYLKKEFGLNMEARNVMMDTVKNFMKKENFTSIETPTLQQVNSGGAAEKFETKLNALGSNVTLKGAPETFLKKALVGGIENPYEISRNFRNEGIDATHNPEFTSIEFYKSFSDYKDVMKMTEKLIDKVRDDLGKMENIEYKDQTIDMSTPFEKIGYDESIIRIGGLNSRVLKDKDSMISYINSEFDIDPVSLSNMNVGKLKEFLFEELVEDKLVNPTFITDYPIEISPLARRNDNNPHIADRFELFIAGTEYANGFSELNDPKDQYERFKLQEEAKTGGDGDAMSMDDSFITALGHGMNSAGGCGIGLDRLLMLMQNLDTIKDAIAFPATRTQDVDNMAIIKKDAVKKEIMDVVTELNDILKADKNLKEMKMLFPEGGKYVNRSVSDHLKEMASSVHQAEIESLEDVVEHLKTLKDSLK